MPLYTLVFWILDGQGNKTPSSLTLDGGWGRGAQPYLIISQNHSGFKRKHLDASSSDDEIDLQLDSSSRFIVIEASNHQPMKLNPFAISKVINDCYGEV